MDNRASKHERLYVILTLVIQALLVLGLAVVQRWSYRQSAAAVVLTVVWLGALAVCVLSVLALLGRGVE